MTPERGREHGVKIKPLHGWPRTPRTAIDLQKELAPRVRLVPIEGIPRWIAGVDAAFGPDGAGVIAGVVLWDAAAGQAVETHVADAPCRFPYIPGLLSFRELPGVLAALRKLAHIPDVLLCDAQGIAHPRRLGLASHLGLWLNLPTVGCAKSRLCGEYDEPGPRKGDCTPLRHGGERIGTVFRTRDRVKPLFVSPGHLCDHETAKALALRYTTRYRLPEPTRLAHQLVTAARNALR